MIMYKPVKEKDLIKQKNKNNVKTGACGVITALAAAFFLCLIFPLYESVYADYHGTDMSNDSAITTEDETLLSEASSSYETNAKKGVNTYKDFSVIYKGAFKYMDRSFDVKLNITRIETDAPVKLKFDYHSLSFRAIKDVVTKNNGQKVAKIARKHATHSPRYNYVLGGRSLSTSTGGIDCAHFVGLVYGEYGMDITSNGADANVQAMRHKLGNYIVASHDDGAIPLSKMQPGDIVIFFAGGHDSHVAIYIGDGKIAHAAAPGIGVLVTDMRYNEKTGIAGYNHKTVQCIIRPVRDTKINVNANFKVNGTVSILEDGKPCDVKAAYSLLDEKDAPSEAKNPAHLLKAVQKGCSAAAFNANGTSASSWKLACISPDDLKADDN